MIPAKTFTEYLNIVGIRKAQNPSWRLGQTAFNVLVKYQPQLAKMIQGTEADPFYSDTKLPVFFSLLAVMWERTHKKDCDGTCGISDNYEYACKLAE